VNGDRDGAAAALARARETAPTNRAVLTDSAELARSMGRLDDAAAYMQVALEQAPTDSDLASTLARVQIESGDAEAALTTLAPWSDAVGTAPETVLAALAVSNAAAGNLDSAGMLHAARTERFPSADSFADRASFLTAREDLEGALAVLEEAVAAFPDMPGLRLQQGRLLAAQTNYAAARAAFDAGLALAPEDRTLMRNASAAERRLGDLDAAQLWAARAAAVPGADAADHVWLGVIATENGDKTSAVTAYRAALDTDGANIVALNNLAALVTEDAPSEAVALARRAVAEGGEQAALMDTLGWALLHDGALPEARTALETALSARPESAITHYHLGRTAEALGDTGAARAAYVRALDIDPAFPGAADARSRLEGQ
jgi:tetratricopeptide (TPR) repeat protein